MGTIVRPYPDADDKEWRRPWFWAVGNDSLLFKRGEHSWHGVRELRCPEGRMRKVFIVVVNRLTPALRMQRLFGDLPKGYSS